MYSLLKCFPPNFLCFSFVDSFGMLILYYFFVTRIMEGTIEGKTMVGFTALGMITRG